MKKFLSFFLSGSVFFLLIFSGCAAKKSTEFNYEKMIIVNSREDGSGTRGAFVELFGVEEKDSSGNKIDYTTKEANVTNSTAVMITSIMGYKYSIGYISLGSLNSSIKAVKIDGVDATAENIKNGTYKISRPFIIVTKSTVNAQTKDFIKFILSVQGQDVAKDVGCVSAVEGTEYISSNPSGRIVVAGSSSVTPLMEKLKEAYLKTNKNVSVEIQQSDSTTGINSAVEGICDIGMASRGIKDSEKSKGITPTVIALDGIAVIVNLDCAVSAMTSEQVRKIFKGENIYWHEIKESMILGGGYEKI